MRKIRIKRLPGVSAVMVHRLLMHCQDFGVYQITPVGLHEQLTDEGMKTIAGKLDVGIQTVAKHRTRALIKMQVRIEAELIRLLRDYPLEE